MQVSVTCVQAATRPPAPAAPRPHAAQPPLRLPVVCGQCLHACGQHHLSFLAGACAIHTVLVKCAGRCWTRAAAAPATRHGVRRPAAGVGRPQCSAPRAGGSACASA